jgi:hypothetical protein
VLLKPDILTCYEHYERLRAVVNEAIKLGCSDVAAIRYLLEEERRKPRERREAIDIGRLTCYERPQPSVADYDRLLASVATEVTQ